VSRLGLVWALCWAGSVVGGAEVVPVPVLTRSEVGRVEVAAVDPAQGHAVAAQAEVAWRALAAPLELPAQFPTPVFVRVLPAGTPLPSAGFSASVEPGGVVSVRLRADGLAPAVVRRALVRGLVLRLAVSWHGGMAALRVPGWLEEAAVLWWETRADGARLDALKQASVRRQPPALADLLQWQPGPRETPGFAAASFWLMTLLQAESKAGEWPGLLRALTRGAEPEAALGAAYPGRFRDERDRELWWQTGWHEGVRARTLPGWGAAESRALLAALDRWVFAAPAGEGDQVLSLGEVLVRVEEPLVTAELARRAGELGRILPALHPFYRNAGLSLAEALAAGDQPVARRRELAAAAERDWRDARELEASSAAALDALEAQLRRR
jgi:hypothetical protein